MLKTEIARKVVEQIARYTDYNVNIMNEKGVIVASRDEARVGMFHDVANMIIAGKSDMVTVTKTNVYPGVFPGINMVLLENGKRIGVVGVTGEPDEIKSAALLIKAAIEAMMKYEHQKEQILRRNSRKERFVSLLIHDEYPNPVIVHHMAEELDYVEDELRIPLLYFVPDGRAGALLEMLKESSRHKKQDISGVLDDMHVIVFKTIPEGVDRRPAVYRDMIMEYMAAAAGEYQSIPLRCFVGSFQNLFTQYYYGYQHCRWLENSAAVEQECFFFYDYVEEYLRSIVPTKKEQRIFQAYQEEFDNEFKENYIRVLGALFMHNWNFPAAAKDLFVHKNSLVYHYKKIKEKMNMNPLVNYRDRQFMEAFYHYLKH